MISPLRQFYSNITSPHYQFILTYGHIGQTTRFLTHSLILPVQMYVLDVEDPAGDVTSSALHFVSILPRLASRMPLKKAFSLLSLSLGVFLCLSHDEEEQVNRGGDGGSI